MQQIQNEEVQNKNMQIKNQLNQKYKQMEQNKINQASIKINLLIKKEFQKTKKKINFINLDLQDESKIQHSFEFLNKEFQNNCIQNFITLFQKLTKQFEIFCSQNQKFSDLNFIKEKVNNQFEASMKMFQEKIKTEYQQNKLKKSIQKNCAKLYCEFMKNTQEYDFQSFVLQNSFKFIQNLVQYDSQKIQEKFKQQEISSYQSIENSHNLCYDADYDLEIPKILKQEIKDVKSIEDYQDQQTCIQKIQEIYDQYCKEIKNFKQYHSTVLDNTIKNMLNKIEQYQKEKNFQVASDFYVILEQKFYHDYFKYNVQKETKQVELIKKMIQKESQKYESNADKDSITEMSDDYNLALKNLKQEIKQTLIENISSHIIPQNFLDDVSKTEMQLIYIVYNFITENFSYISEENIDQKQKIRQTYQQIIKRYLNINKSMLQNFKKQILEKYLYIVKQCNNENNIKAYLRQFTKYSKIKKIFLNCSLLENNIIQEKLQDKLFLDGFKAFMDQTYTQNRNFLNDQQNDQQLIQKIIEIQTNVLEDLNVGCTEQCPFCGSLCSSFDIDEDHDHFCDIHFPQFFNGCRDFFSDKVIFEDCNQKVKSQKCFVMDEYWIHPYKDYKNHPSQKFKRWNIEGQTNKEIQEIFKYMLKTQQNEFQSTYEYKIPEIECTLENLQQFQEAIKKHVKCKLTKKTLEKIIKQL